MSDSKQPSRFVEDEYDLANITKEQQMQAQLKNMREKNRVLLGRLTFLLAVLSLVAAYFLYGFLNRQIDEWRYRPNADASAYFFFIE